MFTSTLLVCLLSPALFYVLSIVLGNGLFTLGFVLINFITAFPRLSFDLVIFITSILTSLKFGIYSDPEIFKDSEYGYHNKKLGFKRKGSMIGYIKKIKNGQTTTYEVYTLEWSKVEVKETKEAPKPKYIKSSNNMYDALTSKFDLLELPKPRLIQKTIIDSVIRNFKLRNYCNVVLSGPTGVGKTSIVEYLAKELNGHILSGNWTSTVLFKHIEEIGDGLPIIVELSEIDDFLISLSGKENKHQQPTLFNKGDWNSLMDMSKRMKNVVFIATMNSSIESILKLDPSLLSKARFDCRYQFLNENEILDLND